jgi:hypothetical protein
MARRPQASNNRSKQHDDEIRAAKISGIYAIAAAVVGAVLTKIFTESSWLFSALS